VKDALVEPHADLIDGREEERAQIHALGEALKEWIRQEAIRPEKDGIRYRSEW
jgi:hypothetical protein